MTDKSENSTSEVDGQLSGGGCHETHAMDSDFCNRSCSCLYLQEDIADVQFIFNQNDETEKRIPAHRTILASGSPVFRSMFYGQLKETGNVPITDCRYESFKEFLQFFYLADITLTMEHVAEVMNLVNKYDAVDCFPTCERFVLNNYTVQIACWALDLAIIFNRTEMHHSLLQKMMEKPIDLFATDSFKHCTLDALKAILSWEQVSCDEKTVFHACIDWAGNACVEKLLDPCDRKMIRQQLGDCLHLIQFAAMSHADIFECISKWSDLFDKNELVDIIALMAADEAGNDAKLKYFVHTGRVKSTQWKYRVVTIEPVSSPKQSDLKLDEIGYFSIDTNASLVAIDIHAIQAKTNAVPGTISADLVIYTGMGIMLKQSLTVPVETLDGRPFSPHRIELSRTFAFEKGRKYFMKFSFERSSWIDGEYTTKKSYDYEAINIHKLHIDAIFGIISSAHFMICN